MCRLLLLTISLLLGSVSVLMAENEHSPRSENAPVHGNLNENLLARLVAEETNRFRVSQGRAPLEVSTYLTNAAQSHATAMADEGFFAHKNPFDPSQRTLTDRIHGVGLEPRAYAENIAYTYSLDFGAMRDWVKNGHPRGSAPAVLEYTYRALAKSVVQQWINSRGHRQNMLGRPYSQIGLGFATSKDVRGREKVYCVQTFCAPI